MSRVLSPPPLRTLSSLTTLETTGLDTTFVAPNDVVDEDEVTAGIAPLALISAAKSGGKLDKMLSSSDKLRSISSIYFFRLLVFLPERRFSIGVPSSPSLGDRGGVTSKSTSLPLSVRFRFFLANSSKVLKQKNMVRLYNIDG